MKTLALAYLGCALFALMLAFFVLGRHEKSPSRDAFLIQVLFMFSWQFGTFFVMIAPNPSVATWLSRIAYIGCIFLSVGSYHLVVNFLELHNQRKYLVLGYCLGLCFLPFIFTDLFLQQVYAYPWGFWFHAGALHPVYLFYFVVYSLATFVNLWKFSHKGNKIQRIKCKFLFWVYVIVYLGITDFLPDYGLAVVPLGFLFMTIWLFAFWFVIKLFDFFDLWKKVVKIDINF